MPGIRTDGYDKRLGHVEQELSAVQQELSAVQTSVRGLEGSVASIANKMDALGSAISASQRTPWGTILGVGALILTIAGYAGSFWARDLGRIETLVSRLELRSARMIDPDDFRALERRVDQAEAELARGSEWERLREKE